MILDFSIKENETEYAYLWRISRYVKDGLINWHEVQKQMNLHWRDSEDEYRDESAYRKPVQSAEKFYDDVFSQIQGDKYIQELRTAQRELQKERYKIQTEKLETNRWLRENARDELITEKIIQAIHEIEPLSVPRLDSNKNNKNTSQNQGYVLAFGDAHYGTEFEIRGLHNEIINAYSPEIFETRMWELLEQTIPIIEDLNISELNVFDMGDSVDGILRVSQLWKLRYGVIESSIKYASFLATWLNELSKYVTVKFQMTFGNHSELRMLGQPKGTFKDDNTGLFIREFIKERLKDNPNFFMEVNPTGLIYEEVCGLNVLGIHGEVKNMENALKDFSSIYNTQIDVLFGGHSHHALYQNVGIGRDVIRVPSMIGVDDYSMSVNKTANAGAALFVLEQGFGKAKEYQIHCST